MDDATPEESKPEGMKPANLAAIIIAIIIVALAGIGGGCAYWTHHETNAYHEAVAQAENADKALSKAVDEATATTYKADQLKEPKLLDKLDDAIRKAKALKGVPNDAPSEWLAWQLASARKANATDADEADAQAKALNAALNAVRDSKLAKELDGAKDQLKQGIDSASQTLKDTDGKVADNATRDSLTKAIDEANNTLSKKGVTDPKTYTDAKAKLEKAVKVVNDSIQAKQAADEKAAQEAAAAQAAAEAQAQAQAAQQQAQSYSGYTGGSYSNYSNSGYTGGSYSNYSNTSAGGGYSAPQHNYTPSTNNGGGSSSGPVVTGGGHAYTCEEEGNCSDRWGAPDQYD